MIRYFLPYLAMAWMLNSYAQTYELPKPVFSGNKYVMSPSLLPDSSIIIGHGTPDNEITINRFVYQDNSWTLAPNQITEILNGITTTGHLHYRFSQDFSRILVTMHGDGPERCYLIMKKENNWQLPVEILPAYRETFGNSVPSFSLDNQKIYKTVTGKEANFIEIFDGTNFELIDRVELKEFSVIERAFAVGNDGLILLAAKMKEKSMGYYYVKEVANRLWSAPLKVNSLPNENGNNTSDPVTTGFSEWILYSEFSSGKIRLTKLPALITSQTKTREYADYVADTIYSNAVTEKASVNSKVSAAGNYHALLIGNSDYQMEGLDLDRPAEDADNLKKILLTQYSFTKENVEVLIDADRSQIFQKLYELRSKLTMEDNLLIFYAGHGYWDKQVQQGYWWPIDASIDNPANWLSNSDLREQIRGINTAHTLLISDACFSGGIFKTRGAEDLRKASIDIKLLYKMQSRRAISSGTFSTVPDNSVFFRYLTKYLKENESKYLPSSELFTKVRRSVLNNSLTVPQDGVIMDSGDEGGDFIFIRKER